MIVRHNMLVLTPEEYKKASPLLFDSKGMHQPYILGITTWWCGPFEVTFSNEADMNVVKELVTS